MEVSPKLKMCCTCKRELPIKLFSKCNSHKDKLQSKCKHCTSIYRKKYYNKNRKLAIKQSSIWQKTHRESRLKTHARRRRNLGFTKLIENDWNEPIEWHHIDNEYVVPIPKYLHKMCHTGDTKRHRAICNKLISILYKGELTL